MSSELVFSSEVSLWRRCAVHALAGFAMLQAINQSLEVGVPAAFEVVATCDAPSPASIQAVTELFDHPDLPPPILGTPQELVMQRREAIDRKEAELGLVFPKYDRQRANELMAPDLKGPQPVFDEYLAFARGVLDQFGIGIRVGSFEGSPLPTSSELEGRVTKELLLAIAKRFGENEMGFGRLLAGKEFILTGDLPENFVGYANPDNSIVLQVTAPKDKLAEWNGRYKVIDRDRDLRHEMYHLLDRALCGKVLGLVYRSTIDPGYAAINNRTGYINTGLTDFRLTAAFVESQPPSDEAVSKQYEELVVALDKAEEAQDWEKFCDTAAKIAVLLEHIEAIRDYGLTAVDEDKADLGAETLDLQSLAYVLDERRPVIRAKTLFLLARLYEKMPGYVEYLSIATPQPREPNHAC